MRNFKKKNKYIKLFIFLFLIGASLSYIYFNTINHDKLDILIKSVTESNILLKPINNITDHFKILSLITLFSMIFIGVPICMGLVISEGFTFFFRIILLYKAYKIKGIFYALIYYVLNNVFFVLITYIIFRKIIYIAKRIYKYKFKNENFNFNEIYNVLIKIIYLIVFMFIIDALTYLNVGKLLNIFAFLLK